MIRTLAGASPVLRKVKPSMGGVCVCALGHWGGCQGFRPSPSVLQRRTSATLPSGYAPGFLSISITIRFTSWENFGSGNRSFGRCPGSYDAVRTGMVTSGSSNAHF